MNICSEGHNEIVYEDKRCPLCDAMAEIDELGKQIVVLEDEIGELKTNGK